MNTPKYKLLWKLHVVNYKVMNGVVTLIPKLIVEKCNIFCMYILFAISYFSVKNSITF